MRLHPAARRAAFLTFIVLPVTVAAQAPSLARAQRQLDVGEHDAARKEASVLAAASPADVAPVVLLGRIALDQGDHDAALVHFERCVELAPGSADCRFWLGNALGRAAQGGNLFRQAMLARRLRAELERAVEIDAQHVLARIGLLQFFMQAPRIGGGSMTRAREQAAAIERASPAHGAIARGMIAEHERKPEVAESAYRRAIAVAPDSGGGYQALIALFSRLSRWTEALATAERLLEAVPSDRATLLTIARLAAESGESLPRGEQAARQWLASPPAEAGSVTRARAHVRIAEIYRRMGRAEAARAEYRTALRLDRTNANARKGSE